MAKRRPRLIPTQIVLSREDHELLEAAAAALQTTKVEVIRNGIRQFAPKAIRKALEERAVLVDIVTKANGELEDR